MDAPDSSKFIDNPCGVSYRSHLPAMFPNVPTVAEAELQANEYARLAKPIKDAGMKPL